MADAPSVELLDFFSMEKGFQSVISKVNPQLLKSFTAASRETFPVPCARDPPPPPLPVYPPVHRPRNGGAETDGDTAPLTIFFNGAVMVFEVPPHKAEGILKLAVSGCGSVLVAGPDIAAAVPPGDHRDLLCTLTGGDLPMARRISLQRFLEKRKERLTSASPCYRNDRKSK